MSETQNPAAGRLQGFGNGVAVVAQTNIEKQTRNQELWLAARFRLGPEHARLIAYLAFGGAHG